MAPGARWVGPRLPRPSCRSFPSLGLALRNREGDLWAWLYKAPPLPGLAFETPGPGQSQRSRADGRGDGWPCP